MAMVQARRNRTKEKPYNYNDYKNMFYFPSVGNWMRVESMLEEVLVELI